MSHGSIVRKSPQVEVLVEDFGAAGNGTTNDAAAIQRAIDKAGDSGTVRFMPKKNYLLNSGLTFPYDNQVVIAEGAQFTVNFSGVGITIGREYEVGEPAQRHVTWHGGRIIRSSHNFSSGNIGMRLLNLGHSHIGGFKIFGFEKGLELLGDGAGTQYNVLTLAEIGYCKHGIALIARNSGWANGNSFFGSGRVGYYENQPNATGGYALYLNREETSIYVVNQNQFYGLALENGMSFNKPAGAIYANCDNCLFSGLRYEGFDSPKINGDTPDFNSCDIHGGAELLNPSQDISLPTATDDPRVVFYHGERAVYWCGGTADDPLFVLRERNSGANPLLELRNTDNTAYTQFRGAGGMRQQVNEVWGWWEGPGFGGSKTWQPTEAGQTAGTIRAGKHACTIVTLTASVGATGSAVPGDKCTVGFTADIGQGAGKDEGGLMWSAQVASDLGDGFNRARVIAFNPTGTDITGIASGTLSVFAKKVSNS